MPPLFVASMGIEKVIPRCEDLALFVRMLSRSALGFDITQYTSHYHGPRPGQEMHIIIVDGACMNTCPVFRRTGGLSYDAAYMGPIGIVLEPSYDLHRYARLPYSCTHCGSCGNVCPVKIPIPELVFYWRNVIVAEHQDELTHRLEEDMAALVLNSRGSFMAAERLGLWGLRHLPKALMESKLNPWAEAHANPEPPKETFRQYYARTNKKEGKK